MTHRYSEIAAHLATSIDKGVYLPGDRLPGVRATSSHEGVSPTTVVAAYRQLEEEGYIEARPRSGFFVRSRLRERLAEPVTTKPPVRPRPVSGQELVLQMLHSINDASIVQLGASIPDPEFLPGPAVKRAVHAASNKARNWSATYEVPPGLPGLRQQVARRMTKSGCITDPEDIVITSGCQEAMFLSLKSVTQPGDVVAIESPTYYGLLQAIDALGLKALEIPTDPQSGMSVDALQLAFEQWPVRACVVVPNFSNPLGALMPPEKKAQLVRLINRYPEVVLIEDDIYGDLPFNGVRPGLLKAMETKHNVIHCSSLSKSLAPGLRIGWIASGRHREQLEYQKFVTNCATSTLSQLAAESLLSGGNFDRHLREMRGLLARNVNRISEAVSEHFPAGTRMTRPAGGMCLWVEFAGKVDTTSLSHAAMAQGISFAPGEMFSSTPGKYKNCLRLNCAISWHQRVERAIATLGRLALSTRY